MNSADHGRRRWRFALLLSAILVPAAAVILLVVRVVHQERELADRRAAEQRTEARDQLRRELTARLQALRLEQVNRLLGESGRRLPPNSPIVFVAPMVNDRMVAPWEDGQAAPTPTAAFERWQREGETQEFQRGNAIAAATAYNRALETAHSPWELCAARGWLARSYLKAGLATDAANADLEVLRSCHDVFDADGVPLALYAAERRLSDHPPDVAVAEHVLHIAGASRWRSPNEALLLQSLLSRMASPAAAQALRTLAGEIRNIEQIVALVQGRPDDLAKLQRASRTAPGDLAWMGYGEEPWLITLVSPSSFAAPVMMAVSAQRILPAGVTLRGTPTAGAMPLGDGFVDLYAEWPASQFNAAATVPGALYAAVVSVVIGAALFAGYLLWRDVHRETETAALRSQFVASVSHELKTPLTSIRAHAETLLMGRAPSAETTTDYLRTIVSESERLGRLVDSVLAFSRIEQGRKTYHFQATQLEEVVRSAARTMEYALSQVGFTLTISSDGTRPTLQGDPEALTQAMLNLLANAMKYSGDARRIEIRLGTCGGEAFADVVDYGIGIARDDRARIFERFQRVQSVETAGIAGTGLGLPLALHVVEAHHGRITIDSEPGRGSTFSMRLPLQAPS